MTGLSVIIPSRNSDNLIPCVDAVRYHEPTTHIIVIDDGLTVLPPGPEYIMGAHPFIFARNCNIGIRAAAADHDVLLLNDDALLETPGGFSLLQQAAAANLDYGIVSASTNITVNSLQVRRRGGRLREAKGPWPYGTLAFIAVLIPRRTIERIGLLDERYTSYAWEDVDYCRRVTEAGLKLGIHDGCYVDHGSLTSTFRGDPRAPGSIDAGRRIYLEKWGTM